MRVSQVGRRQRFRFLWSRAKVQFNKEIDFYCIEVVKKIGKLRCEYMSLKIQICVIFFWPKLPKYVNLNQNDKLCEYIANVK